MGGKFRVSCMTGVLLLLMGVWVATAARVPFVPGLGRMKSDGPFKMTKVANVTYQDSVSIDCGYGGEPYTSDSGITWIPDTFNSGGVNHPLFDIPNNVADSSMEVTLNYYPNDTVNCYEIPMSEPGRYLVRTTFWYDNYDKKNSPPTIIVSFGISTGGVIILHNGLNIYNPEFIFTSSDGLIRLCLVRLVAYPIINGIEVRKLPSQSYNANLFKSNVMQVWQRLTCGNYKNDASWLRYPSDKLDRIWWTDNNYNDSTNDYYISPSNSTSLSIPFDFPIPSSSKNVSNIPPFLLYTARTVPNDGLSLNYTFKHITFPARYMINLFFAEISLSNVSIGDRTFDIYFNDKISLVNFDILKITNGQKFVPVNISRTTYQSNDDGANLRISLQPSSNCVICRPILSGLEVLQIQNSVIPTNSWETSALLDFKSKCDLTNSLREWKYDPCYPIEWTGVKCHYKANETTVVSLNLPNFNLSGNIPSSLSKLSNIKYIFLNNNNFEGFNQMDLEQLSQLRTLDLANNSLSGEVISFPPTLDVILSGNANLCSSNGLYSLPSCSTRNESPPNPHKSNSSSKLVIPIIIGCIIGLAALVSIVVLCLLRSRHNSKKSTNISEGLVKSSPSSSSPLLPTSEDFSHIQKLKFSLKSMQLATNDFHFSKLIGQGGFGKVFFGELTDGRQVAIKQRNGDSIQGKKEFYNEVSLLSRVHYVHLVNLLGYCDEYDNQILVYDYMKNGSLKDHLYDSKGKPLGKLNWKTRLSIAMGAAKGIDYLHNGIKPSIIHRDIKSSNILLDDNYEARVADFGLSRQLKVDESHASTFVKGTAGYVDPEYYAFHRLTDKSDVYSFGVVLLEIIAGREPIDLSLKKEQWSLAEWSRQKLMERDAYAIVDPTLNQSEFTENDLWVIAELAVFCVEPAGDKRPTISKVCEILNSVCYSDDGNSGNDESVDNFGEGTFSDLNTDNDTITDSEFTNSVLDQ